MGELKEEMRRSAGAESIACVSCGTAIPGEGHTCPKCGWSYAAALKDDTERSPGVGAEFDSLQVNAGVGTEDHAQVLMSAALRLECHGDVTAAIAKYEEIIRRFRGTEAASDAAASIRILKGKIE